jgi:hypothetical protein
LLLLCCFCRLTWFRPVDEYDFCETEEDNFVDVGASYEYTK